MKLLFLLYVLLFSFASNATQTQTQQLLEQLDQVQIKLERENQTLNSELKRLESRVIRFNKEISQLNILKDEVEDKHKEISKIALKFDSFYNQLSEQKSQYKSLEEKINGLEKGIVRIESEIGSSEELIAWITVIVSIIVVIIGLFFSKLFLNLYTNYHVVCSHLPKSVIDKAEGRFSNE